MYSDVYALACGMRLSPHDRPGTIQYLLTMLVQALGVLNRRRLERSLIPESARFRLAGLGWHPNRFLSEGTNLIANPRRE